MATTDPLNPEKLPGNQPIKTSAPKVNDVSAQNVNNLTGTPDQSTGIISSAQGYKAPETKPVTTQVDAGQETVEERLNKLTATGSNYTNLAKQDAMRSANSRGLINSSMAAGAGTEAAIRSALPIAQQDAKTYTDTRLTNQNTENDFLKNRQSADLNMETAAQASNLQRGEAKWQNELDMTRDTNSTDLNKSLEILQSSLRMDEEEFSTNLKTQAEQILSDAKFSDEIKLQYVNSINTIVRDTQQQITDIGLSDRTAEQQAIAIQLARDSRDAQVAVYQDLLSSFPDWQWSLDFTQGVQGAAGGAQGAVAANQATDQAARTAQREPLIAQLRAMRASPPSNPGEWAARRELINALTSQLAAIPP
jgi:hypothetical protein